jgi:NitT/TauT family transport system permease protein
MALRLRFLGGIDEATTIQKLIFGIAGVVFVLGVWLILTMGTNPIMNPTILPHPLKVLYAFGPLVTENDLFRNTGLSIGRNLAGYLEALVITVPIGFLVGLVRIPRLAFKKQIDAFRFVPLTALIGVFIAWFGISIAMKVHFLAFGILIYLLPVMIQRIDEIDDVYLKTAHTLGATDWQILRTVYFPSVMSRLFDDLRVLTAIGWTYIIVIETINSGEDGLGSLIYAVGQRQVKIDRLYALLMVIILIGVIQDRIFAYLDREFFPFKYQAKESIRSSKIESASFAQVAGAYAIRAFGWIVLAIYVLLFFCEMTGSLGDFRPLTHLFGQTVWVIHIIVFIIVLVQIANFIKWRNDREALNLAKSKTAKS